MNSNDKNTKQITSVIKAIDILKIIAESKEGLGATEISNRLNQGVSATYHILNTLKACNMIEQDNYTKKYHIGPEVFRLNKLGLNQTLLYGTSSNYLDLLRAKLDETSSLAKLVDTDVMCIGQSATTRMVRTFSVEGARTPFYCTSGGKAIMANMPEDYVENIIRNINFIKFTENTIDTVEKLKEELKKVKEQGYGIDMEERELGVICISAPIFDANGQVIASIGVSGPEYRMKDKLDYSIENVKEIALEFSRKLGYNPR